MENIGEEVQTIGLREWERARPGPLWSWWLRHGKPNGSGLRRWQLWIWWTRQRGLRKQLPAAMRFLRGYLEAPLEAWGGLRHYGRKTAEVHGISRAKQFRDLLMLRWRLGIRPESYYKFQLFRPNRFKNAADFIEESGQLLQVVLRHTPRTHDDQLFLSKEAFRLWCRQHDLPTVDNLIEVEGGRIVARADGPLPAIDLFVKPTNWRQGRGASRWSCVLAETRHHYVNGSGVRLDPVEFEAFVCRTSVDQGRPYIVQPALRNHSELLGFTNGALATVRLMTVRDVGQAPQPLMAALRMPTGDAVADNFGSGALGVPIELASGMCGHGVKYDGKYPPDEVERHPDTGASILGVIVPCWSECIELVCRAHGLVQSQVPVIGWDVAILEDGPILIEANHLPGGNIAQMPSGLPLGSSRFAEVIHERLRRAFL